MDTLFHLQHCLGNPRTSGASQTPGTMERQSLIGCNVELNAQFSRLQQALFRQSAQIEMALTTTNMKSFFANPFGAKFM